MAVSFASKNLIIPKGILYAAEHADLSPTEPAQGYRDVGNCPDFRLNYETETQEHKSSRGGLNFVDDKTIISVARAGSFRTEDIGKGNLAMLFFSSVQSQVQASALTAQTQVIASPKKGLGYHLGQTLARPLGHKKVTVTSVAATVGGTPVYVANTDYEVDADRGFLRILETGSIVDGTSITVTYNVAANTFAMIAAGTTEKAFTFAWHSYNNKGPQYDYWMPFVRVRPSGDFSLVTEGSDYQSIEFEIEVLPLGDLAAIYNLDKPVV